MTTITSSSTFKPNGTAGTAKAGWPTTQHDDLLLPGEAGASCATSANALKGPTQSVGPLGCASELKAAHAEECN